MRSETSGRPESPARFGAVDRGFRFRSSPESLDSWIGAARAQLERDGHQAHPAEVAALLFDRLERMAPRAPRTREALIRAALVRAVRAAGGTT